MTKLSRFALLACSFLAVGVATSSCSSDNDKGPKFPTSSAATVFGNHYLESYTVERDFRIERFTFNYNNDRQLTSIVDETSGFRNDIVVYYVDNTARVTQSAFPGNYDDFVIGDNRFAQTFSTYDKSTNTLENFTLKYDNSGRIISLMSDGNYFAAMSWNDGDITAITGSDNTFVTISYGDQPNRGVMLFDSIYNLKLGHIENLFFGGMLGFYTSHLPSEITIKRTDGTESIRCEWTLTGGGYPARLEMRSTMQGASPTIYNFNWR